MGSLSPCGSRTTRGGREGVDFVAADFSLRGWMAGGSQGDCQATQPASPDLLDILDLLDFVFDFFYGSKSGVEIEDRYPGGWRWPLAGFWRL